MKKDGGGKCNWGRPGDESVDDQIPIRQVFEDFEYRSDESVQTYESDQKISSIDSVDEFEMMKASMIA